MTFFGMDVETIKGFARLVCLSDKRVFKVSSFDEVIYFFRQFKSTYFLAYNADYDIQSFLVYFPRKIVGELVLGIRINFKGISFQYIKNKFFKFGSNYIFDSFQYYKMSLSEASRIFLNAKKFDVDAANITEKNIYNAETVEYCIQDADLSLRLFRYFYDGLPMELKGVKPISTAFYSYSYFRKELEDNNVRKDINLLFRKGYHGGRFEILEKGHFKNLYVYDINSAYPYEISKLKGLIFHRVLKLKEYIKEADFSLYQIKVSFLEKFLSPLVYKYRGLCVYPVGDFEGIVTKGEFERIIEYKPEIISAVHIFGENSCPFNNKIRLLYHLKHVSQNPEVYKVMLNSLYGKTCQSIKRYVKDAEGEVFDVYKSVDDDVYLEVEDISRSNFVYASEITAKVRLRMYDLMRKYSDKVLAVQTDNIISREKLDLLVSEDLGGWKEVIWKEAYLLGSGIYFYNEGGIWKGKVRGFNLKGEQAETILNKILNSNKATVTFDTMKRFSIQESRRIHKEELANQILNVVRVLSINFDRKRIWLDSWKSGEEIKRKKIKSLAIYLHNNLK